LKSVSFDPPKLAEAKPGQESIAQLWQLLRWLHIVIG